MKVTTMGIIQTVKNIGLWLTSYTVAGIKADPEKFVFAFIIYICVSVPTDLYLLNKVHEEGNK